MNSLNLIGNLTRDIEIRYTQSGSAIGNTGLAVNKKWTDQSGQKQEKVMFIDIAFYGKTAENANKFLRKGSKIAIMGEIEFQQWTAQDGSKRSKHVANVKNLEMLDSRPSNGNSQDQNQYADRQAQYENNGQPSRSAPQYAPQSAPQSAPQYAPQSAPQSAPQYAQNENGQPANYQQSQQYRDQQNNSNASNANPAPQGGYSDPQGQRR